MPRYTFKKKDSEEVFELEMSYDELQHFLKENHELEQVFKFPGFVSTAPGAKPPEYFRNILKNIKKNHPHGNVNDNW